MQLMLARHVAERRQVISTVRAAASSERSGFMSAIAAKYADKLARIFDSGDARSAWAARERLKLEEAIETAQATIALSRATADRRRSTLAALRTTQRAERHGLSTRQRRQRAVLGVLLSNRRRAYHGSAGVIDVVPARQVFRLRQHYHDKRR